MYLGKQIMEVKRLVSAEEARRQKLIEYLTAKGKLKPQNNPKPYLKECTNRQNKLTSQVSKTAPVCKQRENVPPKGKSAHPSSSIRTNSNSCVQQTKNAPSKLPTKATISESTKPKTTNVSRNIQSKHRKIDSSKQQQDSPGRIGEAAVKNAHGKNITCELPQNCTNVLDASEECKSNLIQRESVMQEKDCPIADGLRIENATSCSVNKSVNVCGIVQKPSLPGFNNITQAKCKTANAVPQSRSTSSRMTSKSLTDKSKTSYGKDNSKPLPRALHGQRQTSKPVVRVNTRQTKPVSRPNLSTKILNTNNATQTWPVKSSKIETSHQRDPQGAKTTLAPKNNHKTHTVRNPTPCLQSTIAVRRNIGVVQKGTVSSNLKSGSSCVIAPKKISSRPAPSAHSRDIISKKALDNQRGILPVKQGPRWYSTGSSVSTRPAPKNPGSVVVSSVKPVGTMKKEGLVTVNKSVKHNISVVNHTTSQATDTGTSNPARTQYFTPKSAAEDRRKKLDEWLNSKGKTYKRPPMTLPPKPSTKWRSQKSLNCSLWEGIEEEEKMLSLSNKINSSLCDCLELIKQGAPSKAIHELLSTVPAAEKFAKYWICKASLLEREGTFDVVGLYEQAIKAGATPIEELRHFVFDVIKKANVKTKAVTFGPLPSKQSQQNQLCEPNAEEFQRSPSSSPRKTLKHVETPSLALPTCNQGSTVKFQVGSVSSKKSEASSQQWKLLTPVRRSLRITHSVSHYPEVVKDHNTVVASLEELLDVADTDCYVYWRNEALPEDADNQILGMMNNTTIEEEQSS